MSYAKLFSSITESSLWSSSKETRLLFVSMLARANAVGFVEASVPGLARISNLTREETEAALGELMAPDPDDKSGNNEGRRIVKMDGGWGIVNYEIYRNRRDEEERREYMRQYMAQYRKRPVNSSKPSKPKLAQAEAAPEEEAKAEGESALARIDEYEQERKWLEGLGAITVRQGECIISEWKAVTKRLKVAQVEEVFRSGAIQWPSEFKAARKAFGI
jgi:hypothetical protein